MEGSELGGSACALIPLTAQNEHAVSVMQSVCASQQVRLDFKGGQITF